MKVFYVLSDGSYDGEPYAKVEIITTDRKKAEQKLRELNEEVSKETYYDTHEIEFGDYIDYWVDGFYNRQHFHACIEEMEIE